MVKLGGRSGAAPRTSGPPAGVLGMLALALVAEVVAFPMAANQQASAADLAPLSLIGWGAGIIGVLLFMWFRSVDLARSGGRDYAIPSWNPRRVATVLAALAWAGSVAHAYVIADALSRR